VAGRLRYPEFFLSFSCGLYDQGSAEAAGFTRLRLGANARPLTSPIASQSPLMPVASHVLKVFAPHYLEDSE
jgi:hypothetical protein